ncbi:MAG TPA: T9SS type A sorting domain-containing protein [Candidatus Kapabacteria bacterium]
MSSKDSDIIINASASPNPTGTGTVLTFGTAKEAYVIVNLYDVLGHTAGTAHFEGSIEPGNHSIPLSLIGLPPGTYFARIQTTYAEVQSVKIVKE